MALLPAETGAVCRPRKSYPRAAEASRAKAPRWDVRHRIKLGEGRGTPEYPRPSCSGGAKQGSTLRRKGVLALSARYAEWGWEEKWFNSGRISYAGFQARGALKVY